jgi:hypothetical protein
MTAKGFTSLYGDCDYEKDVLEINRKAYKTVNTVSDELLGRAVFAYVNETKQGEVIIDVWENKKETQAIYVAEDDFIKAEGNEIKYFAEKEKKIKVSDGVRVIYNGVFVGNLLNATEKGLFLNPSDIVAIDNDDDNFYDVIKIKKNEYGIYNSYSEFFEMMKLTYPEETINLLDSSYELTFDGVESDFSQLKAGDVLTINKAFDGDGKAGDYGGLSDGATRGGRGSELL